MFFRQNFRRLLIITCGLIVFTLSWVQPGIAQTLTTNVAMINQSSTVIAIEGVTDKVEGKVQEEVGTAKRNLGKATGQVEGAVDQAKGKAKQGLGEAKNKLDNVQDDAEDASENLLDSVKDFFSN